MKDTRISSSTAVHAQRLSLHEPSPVESQFFPEREGRPSFLVAALRHCAIRHAAYNTGGHLVSEVKVGDTDVTLYLCVAQARLLLEGLTRALAAADAGESAEPLAMAVGS